MAKKDGKSTDLDKKTSFLTKLLVKSGNYYEGMAPQVQALAQIMLFTERIWDKILSEDSEPLAADGKENPLYTLFLKSHDRLQDALRATGMNRDTKTQAPVSTDKKEHPLTKLMERFNEK